MFGFDLSKLNYVRALLVLPLSLATVLLLPGNQVTMVASNCVRSLSPPPGTTSAARSLAMNAVPPTTNPATLY
jgi:hypothetical protein